MAADESGPSSHKGFHQELNAGSSGDRPFRKARKRTSVDSASSPIRDKSTKAWRKEGRYAVIADGTSPKRGANSQEYVQ